MRIVARPDFDGIVCAVLLYEALDINKPVLWVEPNAMQDGQVEIRKGDIIANLSYQKNCTLWFDHRGAGSCCFHVNKTGEYLQEIIDTLLRNEN